MLQHKNRCEPDNKKEIIVWWEKRRLNFNLLFFTLSFAVYFIVGKAFGSDIERDMPMWVILELGVFANILYLLNWLTDILLVKLKKGFPHSFRKYFYRSVLVVTSIVILGLGILVILLETG